MVLVGDAVRAVHVAGGARDIERLAGGVALEHRHRLVRRGAFVEQPPEPQARGQTDRDLGLHVGELLLHELIGGEGPAELPALQHVVARRVPAELRRPQRPPGDAVAGAGKAPERPPEPGGAGQLVFGGDEDTVHHDLAGGRCPQRELAVDLRGGQAPHAPLQNEPADDPLVVLRPDHEEVGNRSVADPGLRSRQPVAAINRTGPGGHRAGVRAGVGLGEPEAADQLPGREVRQVLLALRLVSVGMNGVHDQARLHADRRAVAGIDPLDLPGDEPVAHISGAGAAVSVDGGTEQPALPHLPHDGRVEVLGAVRVQDARHQRALRVVAGGVPDQALLLGEGALQQKRIGPVEAR